MNRTLSIPEWHRLAQEGTKIPVRIPLMGMSMYPLIRYNRDLVTVIPPDAIPRVGDIVLFMDYKRNLYVMHRVWELKEKMVLTWGDNCKRADAPRKREDIYGLIVSMEKNGKMLKKWKNMEKME